MAVEGICKDDSAEADIQPGAEKHDGKPRHKARKEAGKGLQPQQEQQEHRGAEADPEALKVPGEGVYLGLSCQGNHYEHKEENQPVPSGWRKESCGHGFTSFAGYSPYRL